MVGTDGRIGSIRRLEVMDSPEAPAPHLRHACLVIVILLGLVQMETLLPEALRPLGRLDRAPRFVELLRGKPSPDRPYFARKGPEPPILVLRAIGTALLIAYGVCELLLARRARSVVAWVLVALLVLFLYVVPALVPITARHATGDPAFAHDGGTIQIEEAARMLAHGRNPYRESYRGTALEHWRGLDTPIVDHLPYFPWAVVPLVPAVALLDATGLTDLRLAYLPCAAMLALLLAWPARHGEARRLLALLPFFCPLLAGASILGTNDLFAILWVAAALLLLERGRDRAGMVVLGLAMAVKQFCWPLWPLVAAYEWGRGRRAPRLLSIAPVTLALVALPFLLWDAPSFVDDTFGYALGGSATTHPIKGVGSWGFGTLALAYGLVSKATAPFPYSLVGLLLTLAVGTVVARRLSVRPDMPLLLMGFSLALLPFLYFSRYFHGNFLGYALLFLLWGVARSLDGSAAHGIQSEGS